MVNMVILVGNLGADPETRTTGGGTVVANLRLATTDRRKDKDGNWGEQTEWHRIVCFGTTAENVARYLKKGRQVYVEGKIQTKKYQDKDGNDKYSTEILADQIKFLGGNPDRESDRDDRGGSSGNSKGNGNSNGGGRSSGNDW